MRRVDRLAVCGDWDGVLALRDACLAAMEETGRQLWGPARFAAYRTALDAPAPLAAAMLEPGVVRFGLGPLTEVIAQHHTFAELAPHLDAALLPVVAQERVLRGEDLTGHPLAQGEPDAPPLRLQAFEPSYALPEYRADERLDGTFALPDTGWRPLALDVARDADRDDAASPHRARPVDVRPQLARALEDVVAPWVAQSGGTLRVATATTVDEAMRGVLDAATLRAPDGLQHRPLGVAELLGLLAFAGASGGVHGRRRGGAAGRAAAWWVARCATGLDRTEVDAWRSGVLVDELEFRLEDLVRFALRTPGEAAWRLELALGTDPDAAPDGTTGGVEWGGEWGAAILAFDLEDPAIPEDPAIADPRSADRSTNDGRHSR